MRIILLLIFLSSWIASGQNLPEPYNQLKELLPFDAQGWYSNEKEMKHLLKKHPVKVVFEVGSWLGLSTRHIARHIPKDGKVYAIDHWLGSNEHQPGQEFWREKLPQIYEQFLSNVIHKKLTHKIIPVRMASVDAEKYLSNIVPDLIYIDANHETEAVYQDLSIWYPHVKGHGILCGDDWTWDSVKIAVKKFAAENHLTIESHFNFWRLIEAGKN